MKKIALLSLLICPFFILAQMIECEPPSTIIELDINNTRASIYNSVSRNMNNGSGGPGFEAPKDSDRHLMYAEGLWIGGYTPDGLLHFAGGSYGTNGTTDFYPGPLSNNFASTDSTICNQFDDIYVVDVVDVLLHKEYFHRLENGLDLFAPPFQNGYNIPDYFYEYPANHYDPDFSFDLAPYFDYNGDNIYNPVDGDYPTFDYFNSLNPDIACPDYNASTTGLPLRGHRAAWFVCNDNGGEHTESGGLPIGLEIQVTAYQFKTCDALDDVTFTQNIIINRGTNTLERCFIGKWGDPDVGCFSDDYVGCDVSRGMAYAYNSADIDPNCQGVAGYGTNPPVLGIDLLRGPYQDDDGLDNPISTDVAFANSMLGIVYPGQGTGFGDSEVDNERLSLGGFTGYSSPPAPCFAPSGVIDLHDLLSGTCTSGDSMTFGGDGTSGAVPTRYLFPGDSDPYGAATYGQITNTNWSETTAQNTPADRRFLMQTGGFSMEPGEVNEVSFAHIYGENENGINAAISSLGEKDDLIQAHFDECFATVDLGPIPTQMEVIVNGNQVEGNVINFSSAVVNWDFGDGNAATGNYVQHTYASSGSYAVMATIEACGEVTELSEEIDVITSINEFDESLIDWVYPDPTHGLVSVQVQGNLRILAYEIYDSQGRLVERKEGVWNERFDISVGRFEQGVYHVVLMTDRGSVSKKFLSLK